MKQVGFEDVGSGNDVRRKLLVVFKEREQKLVLNVTNATSIAALHGDDTDRWPSKRIRLIASKTTYQGKPTACVRVERPDNEDLGF